MAGQRFFSFCWFSIRCQMPMSHDNQCENTSIISCQCVISLGFNFRHSFLVQVSWWAAQLTCQLPRQKRLFISSVFIFLFFLSLRLEGRSGPEARGCEQRPRTARRARPAPCGGREREGRGGQKSLNGQPVGTSGVATSSTAATVATVCDPEALSRSPNPS